MKQTIKFLTALLMLLMSSTGAWAEKTAYAVLTDNTDGADTKTLTFKYEDFTPDNTTSWDVTNTGTLLPKWNSEGGNITQVVFDPSFADARPKTCYCWFSSLQNLTTITGIENLNTSEVTRMRSMFYYCSSLTSLDLSHFDTNQVTNMGYMFYGCGGLTSLDVSNFNTSQVTDMGDMFNGCSSLTNLDLSSFNTSKVEYMNSMFEGCSSLTSLAIGSGFTVRGGINTEDMFSGCSNLDNGTLKVIGTVEPDIAQDIFGVFTDGTLITDKALESTIDDDWKGGSFTTVKRMTAYAVLTGGGSNKTLTFKCEEHTLGANEWDVSNTGGSLPEWFSERENITQVVFESSFADARPKTCHSWFWIFRNLTTITGIENLNTSQVTTMASMFAGCSSLTNLDVSHFNTSQVTDMSYLFYGCSRLTSLDVSSFNTSEVTYMECMFAVCSSLTSLDLSSFNTSQVTDMSYMFLDCSSLTSLSIGKDFTVGGGTDTDDMFSGCTALENGTLIVKGTSAPSIAKDIFGVFTNGTLVTAISQTDLGYTGPDADGKYTWKGGKFNKSMKLTNNLGANVTVTFYKSAAEPTEAFADAPGDEADIANGGDWIVMHIVPADGYWTDAQLLMASEAVAGYWTDAQLPMTQEAAVSLARAKAPGLDLGQIPTLLKRDTYTDTEGTHDRQDGAGWYYYQIPADHTPAAGYTTSTIEGYVVPKFDLMSDTPAPEISEDKKKYTFKALPDWSVEVTLDDVSFTCTGTPQCPKITNEKLEVKKGNNVIVTFTNVSDHITTSGTATDAGTDHAFTIGAVANSIFANSRNLTFSIGEVPASITVNTESLELEIDDTYTIVATTTPEGLPVTYVPDDSGIYCVDVNGNVTALRVGVGSILVKVGGDGVYAVDSKTITVHVTKTLDENNITLDIPTGGYVYDGTPKEPTVTVKYGNKTFTKGTDYNVTYSNNVNAGENTATVTVTDIPGGDYNVSGTKTFSIAKKDLTVTAKDQTIDYGTEIATGVAQVTANGLLGTDAVSSVTLTASTTEMTSTGTITASDAVIKNDETDVTANYEIKYEPSALIIEYAMTLAAGYATFCSPFDLQLPDGLKAYTVSAVGDKSVELTEQTAIGKDVAMILHAEAAGTYKLRKGEAQTFISVPDFVGVTSAAGTDVSTVAGEVYILKNGQFVWGRTGVVPQYRCYLVLGSTAGARSLSLVIAGDTNGIDHLLWSDEDDDSWYTLDGRKLEGKPTVKGLYIMIPANDRSKGKTVMIK